MRDDFSEKVKRIVALRVGYLCSNCRAPTSGPHRDTTKSLNVGVAAHITAASPKGPRYNPNLTSTERKHPDNAIWLCQNHGKLVDSDAETFTVDDLREWKRRAEIESSNLISKTGVLDQTTRKRASKSSEAHVRRNLALKKRMQKDFLKPPGSIQGRRPTGPYEKFAHSEAIIHSVDDKIYPEVDNSPGISGWFKVELWDFYFNGLEAVLTIVRGIIDRDGRWSLVEYKQEFDKSKYREINMWCIGRIPWRNIATYDIDGDEHYPFPHLYCRFNDNGTPYEEITYRVVDDTHDWPLESKNRFEYKS